MNTSNSKLDHPSASLQALNKIQIEGTKTQSDAKFKFDLCNSSLVSINLQQLVQQKLLKMMRSEFKRFQGRIVHYFLNTCLFAIKPVWAAAEIFKVNMFF